MLVAFISGITIGSWMVSLIISRLKNLIAVLAICQFGVVVSMILSLPLYERLPFYLWQIASVLSRTESAYPLFLAAQFLLCFALMFAPTVFLGMSLPIASRIASRDIAVLGSTVGNVFSLNTLGMVLGSLIAGLVLIPMIGIRSALEVGIIINLVLGILLLAVDTRVSEQKKFAFALPVVVVCALYLMFATGWNQSVMLMSIFRQIAYNAPPPRSFSDLEREAQRKRVLYYREGVSATVAVTEIPASGGVARALSVNGRVDASSHADLPTQVLLGQFPMLLHPKVDNALVFGLGSGITLGSILTHPVQSVDCVEISPEVLEAARLFDELSNRPLDDPRVRVVVDDALAYLKLAAKRYDLIVSEPSRPWVAGVGNLFTREFFRQCRERLRPGGWMVQWFHQHEMGDETFQLVLRTLREIFPHVILWQSLNNHVILIASSEPFAIQYDLIQARMDVPSVRKDLERISIPDAMTLLSLQALSEEAVARYADYGPVNTENLPLLEYWAPRDLFLHRTPAALSQYDERLQFGGASLFLKSVHESVGLTDTERLNIGSLHAMPERGVPAFAHAMLSSYLQNNPRDVRALQLLAQLSDRFNRTEESLAYLKRIVELKPNDAPSLSAYAWKKFLHDRAVAAATVPFDISDYVRLLQRCIELAADTADVHRYRLGEVYYRSQRFSEALPQLERAYTLRYTFTPDPEVNDEVLRLHLAEIHLKLGNYSRALQYAVEITMGNPRNRAARDLVYTIWTRMGKPRPAE
jgi:spermidine synthase/tetratricopeptide (TPR) repeat protein